MSCFSNFSTFLYRFRMQGKRLGLARKIYFSSGIYIFGFSSSRECHHSSEARDHLEPGSAAPAPTGGHSLLGAGAGCAVCHRRINYSTQPSRGLLSPQSSVLSPQSSVLTLLHPWNLEAHSPHFEHKSGGPIWPDQAVGIMWLHQECIGGVGDQQM